MSITYREGALADLPQLVELNLKAYGQHRPVIGEENWLNWERTLLKTETYSDLFLQGTCFVSESEGQIIGTGFYTPRGNPWRWFKAEWSYIRLVGVLPEFNGKGIGRQITQMCIDKARSMNDPCIALHTSEFQHSARHIYESMGFKQIEQFEQHQKTFWIYQLNLTL